MKKQRQQRILEIINSENIETQEQLIAKLEQSGFATTQATVSRDIRELKLVKVSIRANEFKYAESTNEDIRISAKYKNILRETLIKADYAANMIILKTYAGMAQAAAAAIDNMGWSEIVGTIAGDDTILMVMRNNDIAKDFYIRFTEVLKNR